MNSEKLNRRLFLRAAAAASATALFAACQPKVVEKVVEKEVTKVVEREVTKVVKEVVKETVVVAGTPQVVEKEVTRVISVEKAPDVKQWTLSLDLGTFQPTNPKITTKEGELRKVAALEVAEVYQEVKPNVDIEWYYLPANTNATEWVTARMVAQDAPDVWSFNPIPLYQHLGKGWALDLTEWVNMPNPYMPGKRAWNSYMDPLATVSQLGPDGKPYGISLNGDGVLWVTNDDAFDAAGIDKRPETWAEFIEACAKLKDAGYIAIGGDYDKQCCYFHWSSAHLHGHLSWDYIFDYDDDKNLRIAGQEVVTHSQIGDWPVWESELMMAKLLKEQEPYLPLGYTGFVDYRQLWRQGKVGMYMTNNPQAQSVIFDPPPFEYGWLFYPTITKDKWPAAPEKKVRLQGCYGAWHLPGYLPKTDPDRIPVINDFLMFLSQSQYVTDLCAESTTIPLIEGCTTIPELAPFAWPYDRELLYQSWNVLTADALTRERELVAEFVSTSMTDNEYLEKGKVIWADELRKALEAHPDWKI